MANVLVEENVLSNIASAIREKNGTSTQYYPGQFAEEIRKIESGGGSSDSIVLANLIDKTISSITNSYVTNVGVGAFENCYSLTTVNFPYCKSLSMGAFNNCYNLINASLPLCENIGWEAFRGCDRLTTINLPCASEIGDEAFAECERLESINLSVCKNISRDAFYQCYCLSNVTIGASSVCTIYDAGVFFMTLIDGGVDGFSGIYGSIYVPASLVSAYKSASNWSLYSDRITAIEEEGEIEELDPINSDPISAGDYNNP